MKLDINYENIDFDDLSEKIFSTPPQEKCSIPVSFNDNLKDMHEALVMFFTKGMKKKFGDKDGKVDLLSLSDKNFFYINNYFESISIKMNYKFYDITEYDSMYNNHFSDDKYNNLEDYCFKLKIHNKIFVLWFKVME